MHDLNKVSIYVDAYQIICAGLIHAKLGGSIKTINTINQKISNIDFPPFGCRFVFGKRTEDTICKTDIYPVADKTMQYSFSWRCWVNLSDTFSLSSTMCVVLIIKRRHANVLKYDGEHDELLNVSMLTLLLSSCLHADVGGSSTVSRSC